MSVIKRDLNILSWNAQSISSISKLSELQLLLHNENIDIVCLQETYLSQANKLYLNNFTLYRNDRKTHGGGVAIGIKKGIRHRLLNIYNTKSIENISVAITVGSKSIIVTCAYSPNFTNDFSADISCMMPGNDEFLIIGDLNAKHTFWNCVKNNRAGTALFNLQNNRDFVLHNTLTPTHFPHSGATPSVIDLLLTNLSTPIHDVKVLADQLSSDHRPVLCRIEGNTVRQTKKCFNYKFANWRRYAQIITNGVSNVTPQSTTDIDAILQRLTTLILDARRQSIPLFTPNCTALRLAPDTISAISYKNSLTRQWQRCTNDVSKRKIKSEINIINILIRELSTRDRNNNWQDLMRNINTDKKKYWKISRSLRGKNECLPNILLDNNTNVVTNVDKAEALAGVFEKSHVLTINQTHTHDQKVHRFIREFNRKQYNGSVTDGITTAEIASVLQTLRPFKAPGEDGIQNILLKQLPTTAIDVLKDTFNKCFQLSYWPTTFKTAKVIPIPKPGKDKNFVENFRPISLLSAIGKLYEKLVLKRLTNFSNANDVITAVQFGFRQEHSTSHQILRVSNHIKTQKAIKKSTGMVLFDIEKAFDSVWHDGLVFKLHKFKFPVYLCKLVQAFCRGRQFEVHVHGSKSKPRSIPAGLPQGSVLSPSLYCIFVSDLLFPKEISAACYADDTAIYTSANRTKTICKRLQQALVKIEDFFGKWKIKVNPTKTQAIVFPFNNQLKRRPSTNLTLNGSSITFAKEVKYLGVTIDSKLNFGAHIKSIRAKAIECTAALYPMLCRKSKLSTRNKLLLFKAIIRPVLTYAAPIWKTAAISHRKHLQIIQSKCLKTIYKLPWRYPTAALHTLSGQLLINDFITISATKFSDKCVNSNFMLIRELANFRPP